MTELSFGREYSAAVESKQVAQQEAQRAAFVVDRALQEKQQKIVQAEGKEIIRHQSLLILFLLKGKIQEQLRFTISYHL